MFKWTGHSSTILWPVDHDAVARGACSTLPRVLLAVPRPAGDRKRSACPGKAKAAIGGLLLSAEAQMHPMSQIWRPKPSEPGWGRGPIAEVLSFPCLQLNKDQGLFSASHVK